MGEFPRLAAQAIFEVRSSADRRGCESGGQHIGSKKTRAALEHLDLLVTSIRA